MTNTQQQLAAAIVSRTEARWMFSTAVVGTKAWRDAEETLSFWQGKVAALDARSCAEVRALKGA